ncbi:MAG: WecB/TagA/CpsF family glycosyltransferase [Hyphomicrobiaceae bacterium]
MGSLAEQGSVRFLGAPFDLADEASVVAALRARRPGDHFRYIVTPNVDHVVRLRRRADLVPAYEGAWISLCDSRPIRMLARLLGLHLPHLAGADLTARIFADMLEPGDGIAVVGADETVLDALRRDRPELVVTGHVPPMGFVDDPAAFAAAIDFAATSTARFLFLAVGSPQSERLAAAIAADPRASGTALCIGASLEFLTGHKTRAPRLVRGLGLEWLHRLATEPRRLWRRYVFGVWPLLALFAREVIARLGGRRRQWSARPRHAAPSAVVPAAMAAATPLTRPLVLHITGDYPDPLRAPTTVAVKRLVDELTSMDHVVFSLDRQIDPRKLHLRECPAPAGQRLFAFAHFGLPLGVGLRFWFWLVARRIRAVLEREGLRPDLVHSHRLAFDGLAGRSLARELAIPHFVSVRGETESKIIRFKPTYRPLLREIVATARRIYYVSAWYRPQIEALDPAVAGKARPLPNIVANARAVIPIVEPRAAFVAAANFDIWRKKGLDRLVKAFSEVAGDMPGVTLDVFGSGRPASVAYVESLIARHGLGDRVRLRGKVANADFLAELPGYQALLMPSRNETFGMVYAEALFAGVPILYSLRTGIDGYLDGLSVGIGVDPNDITAIGTAIVELHRRNAVYRAAIARAAPELYRRLNAATQIELYESEVAEALGGGLRPPSAASGDDETGLPSEGAEEPSGPLRLTGPAVQPAEAPPARRRLPDRQPTPSARPATTPRQDVA